MKKMWTFLLALTLVFGAFGCSAGGEASVQSVAMICGIGPVGVADRYGGVVVARGEVTYSRDDQKGISEILVHEGDEVAEGQILFKYDLEQAQISLERAQLELQQMRQTISAKQSEIRMLEDAKAGAGADEQLSYTLAIQEAQTVIRETQYNVALKEKEVERIEAATEELDVKAPFDGRVIEVHEEAGYDQTGQPLCVLRLMETGAYRVKGYINEMNIYALQEGAEVLVRSRYDERETWKGVLSMIDFENPQSASNNDYYMYGASDGMTTSSKYPFYVEMEDTEGLILGQHVFIEPDLGEGLSDGLHLPAAYLVESGAGRFVWAKNSLGKLEKRTVTVGEYNEMEDTYLIESGLSVNDYIAFPDETLRVGMNTVSVDENNFIEESGIIDEPYVNYEYEQVKTDTALAVGYEE